MNKTADLAFWINERYSIKLRREQGIPPPWTGDKVMATTRFCNVHREDDKVTRWLAQHWRPRYHEVWHILLARLINNIPTLEVLLPQLENMAYVKGVLKERRRTATIFGNAYTVSTNGRAMDKVDYVIDHVVVPAMQYAFLQHTWWDGTLEQAARILCTLNGVSTFMAGQVLADLKNTPGHPLQNAPDRQTWAAPGPGSLRGLSAYYGRPVTAAGFTSALQQCYAETKPLVCDYVPPIDMQDFQNCMCEFSKYVRVQNGGHARNRYSAAT